jgi:hypothetical protein
VPTWTALLDAMAVARITNSLDRGAIPAIRSVTRDDRNRLDEMNGLDGVVDSGYMDEEVGDPLEVVIDRRLAKIAVQRAERRRTMKDCQCSRCRRRRTDAVSSDGTIESLDLEITRVGIIG